MARILCSHFCLILLIFLMCLSCAADESKENAVSLDKSGAPIISGKAACLMDAQTGQILYKKAAYAHLPNASTTKLMTCIITLDKLSPEAMLTASKSVAETQFTSLYLTEGEQISVKDALAGAMIKSANDACMLLAEAVSGSSVEFSSLMNKKALEFGMYDTHFVTPNGLYNKDHYSSARDMCLLGREAMKYQLLMDLAVTKSYVLDSRTINRQNVLIKNKTDFIKKYPYATGLKSGYIKQAGNCLVGSAEKNDVKLVSCIMNSSLVTDETIALMNYGFDGFEKKVLLSKDEFRQEIAVEQSTDKIVCRLASDLYVLKKKHEPEKKYIYRVVVPNRVKASAEKGDKVGFVRVFCDKQEVCSVDLVIAESIKQSSGTAFGILLAGLGLFVWKIVKIILLFVVALVLLIGVVYYVRKIAKNIVKIRSGVKEKLRRSHNIRSGKSKRYNGKYWSKGRRKH